MKRSNLKGFTTLELLIVTGILGIVATSVTLLFLSTQANNERSVITNEIISTLRKNQSLAMSGENQSAYGVFFDTSAYIEFEGDTYVEGAGENIEHQLPAGVALQNIDFGGNAYVYFHRLTGKANETGAFEIKATGLSGYSTININELGTVSVQKSE